MKQIAVASTNPVKVNATVRAFEAMFPGETFQAEGVSVPSDVADQPFGNEETLAGAKNRAAGASRERPDADFFVGIEGGVEDGELGAAAFAWTVVLSKDGRGGTGRTGTFFLPPQIRALLRQGMELGAADDAVFGRTNSKQESGAVGLLTGNVIDRTRFYADAVTLALIPFKNESLYAA